MIQQIDGKNLRCISCQGGWKGIHFPAVSVVWTRHLFAAVAADVHSLLVFQFIKYAPTVARYVRPTKIHKQSLGHPWPSSDPPPPPSTSHRFGLSQGVLKGGLPQKKRMLCRYAPRRPAPKLQRQGEDGKRWKTFLGSPAAREPGASSIQHGSVRTRLLSGKWGCAVSSAASHKITKRGFQHGKR